MQKIKVIITQLPIDTFSYFQWFLLGLYELEIKGEIELKFKISLLDKIVLLWFNNKYLAGVIRQLKHRILKVPRYNLLGYIESNNIRKSFVIDSKDSPFIFNVEHLKNYNCYFKNQCPKTITKEGFNITPNILVPYFDINLGTNNHPNDMYSRIVSDDIFKLKSKIYPGMVGPRRLAWSCKYKIMKKQYEKYLQSQNVIQTKKIVAYFGSAFGPQASSKSLSFDLDWEPDLMAFLNKKGNHPNEKRAIAVDILNSIKKEEYDGRLIFDTNKITHKDKIVNLSDFCDFIAQFSYNLNISGFRLSIPNRFIESFIGGTAILTDKLYVKWYLPFEQEVVETTDMGYLNNHDVNWDQFKNDLIKLPTNSKEDIINLYEKKWSPIVFANYIIRTTLNS